MPDFLSSNRFRNLFPVYGQMGRAGAIQPTNPFEAVKFGSTQFNPIGVQPSQLTGEPDTYDVSARMRELYQPTYDATQQFENIISRYPEREKPGWLRTIAAMLRDYTHGPEAGKAMYEQPFREKLEDWKNQIVPMQAAANLERQENVNARTLAYQQISQELRDKAQEAKERNDERSAAIRQQRADVYDFKARNPNMRIVLPKGGNITAINPQTGETHDLGIPTGILTETDKLNMQQEGAMARIAAGGAEARATEGVRQAGRETIAETRGWQIYNVPDPNRPGQIKAVKINAITGEVKDITAGEKPVGVVAKPSGAADRLETAANKKVRQYLLAKELYDTRPDLRPFIKLDKMGPNTFDLEIPRISKLMGSMGPTQAQYDEIQDYIYGEMPTTSLGGAAKAAKPTIISITPVK